jgi:hypothetical protein
MHICKPRPYRQGFASHALSTQSLPLSFASSSHATPQNAYVEAKATAPYGSTTQLDQELDACDSHASFYEFFVHKAAASVKSKHLISS